MRFEDWFIAHARVSGKAHARVKLDDTIAFFQQLGTLISAGTPLLDAIQMSVDQCESLKLKDALQDIANRVATGSSLSGATASYPKIFEQHWIEVIRTGEVTGKMPLALTELNRNIAEARQTKRKITGSLMYPIMLIIAAVAAVTVMLWLVVPTFAEMFDSLGTELPGITQTVVDLSDFIVEWGFLVLLGIIGVIVGFKMYIKKDPGRSRVFAIGLALPVVGDLMVQSAMYRFASNISLLLKSGVPMLETMGVLRKVFNTNPTYREAIASAEARVATGWSLMAALEETELFTPMLTNMVRIGEESGELATVMDKIAPYYKERMEGFITKVTKLLEPVIIVGLGGTIAFLMLAIYLPMFEMAGKVH